MIVIDPRPVFLPLEYHHLPVRPEGMNAYFHALLKGAVDRDDVEKIGPEALAFYDAGTEESPDPETHNRLSSLQDRLRKSSNPVIVCGTDIVPADTPSLAADWAMILKETRGKGGLFYLLPGPNAFGAALSGSPDRSFMDVVEEIERGEVRALVLVESDPFRFFPDRERLEKALKELELLIVLDYAPSGVKQFAHILLPTRTLYEAGGTYVNQAGLARYAPPAYRGGLPIAQTAGGEHPPREFRADIPGNDPRAAWRALEDLEAGLLDKRPYSQGDFWEESAAVNPIFGKMLDRKDQSDGVHLVPEKSDTEPFLTQTIETENESGSKDAWDLLLVDRTFGTEELSSYSEILREASDPPRLTIHARDAAELGLDNGSRVRLDLGREGLEIDVQIEEKMARGVLILPRHEEIYLQKVEKMPVKLNRNAVKAI